MSEPALQSSTTYLTLTEVAAELRMDEAQLLRLSRQGRFPTMLAIPGTEDARMLRADFESWRERNQTAPGARSKPWSRAQLPTRHEAPPLAGSGADPVEQGIPMQVSAGDYTLECQLVNGIVRPAPWDGPVVPRWLITLTKRARSLVSRDHVDVLRVLDWVLEHQPEERNG
ncbi:MAG: helix-turn-helix domain-containing protein [bacterium]|nr:helix-turn-helix domain-containing protein [bacterium]